MKMTNQRTAMALAMSAMLAGCMMGPDYKRPTMELPASYAPAPVNAATVAASHTTWWTIYNSPTLRS